MSADKRKIEEFVDELRAQILNGDYGTRGRIPTVEDLTRKWETSRSTVYYVLQILQSDGLLRREGRSFVTNHPKIILEGITENFERFLKAQGYEVTMENLISPTVETMPSDIAAFFGQSDGIKVVHRMRKQGIKGLPLRIAENWYPASLAGQFVNAMQADEYMDVLGAIKATHGVFIVRTEDELESRLPSSEEARLLDLVTTAPVVEIRRRNLATDGTPVMFNKITHVAAHFKFTYRYEVDHWK
jgi:DNA-binding GntR family transcriptional regulator